VPFASAAGSRIAARFFSSSAGGSTQNLKIQSAREIDGSARLPCMAGTEHPQICEAYFASVQ
jgi:hypothetical protein